MTSAHKTCGAWPDRGGCILPAGHNQGMADVPSGHQFPRSITFRLPMVAGEPEWVGGSDVQQRVCSVCEKGVRFGGPDRAFGIFGAAEPEPVDMVIVSAALGTVHTTCYLSKITSASLADAWLIIAAEIAKHPSKHTAAEIRAALTALTRLIREK